MELLLNPKFLPTVQMGVSLLAGIVYLMNGDVRRAIYWISSVVLVGAGTY